MIVEGIFWICAAIVFYTFAGYPILMVVLAGLRPRPVQRAPIRPTVSLLIVAHNEAATLARKLENSTTLDYPADRIEVVLASDGSSDATVEIGRKYEPRGVRVLAFPVRRGKPSVLNDAIPQCHGEIIVLSDARQSYDGQAISALVENFADPAVGAVSGELYLDSDPDGRAVAGVGYYWRYEKTIRRSESAIDSTIGATGCIYAIRRALFESIPADTLLDDVLIPVRAVRSGYRVIFEPRAKALDTVAKSASEEFTRKVRTLSGNAQLFARERWLWNPAQNRLWAQTVSHKLLRLVAPACLLGVLASSVILVDRGGPYKLALFGQLSLYGAALIGALGQPISRWRCFSVPYAFCLLNVTAVVGVLAFLSGRQRITWQKATDTR
jgi:poly-beta-1,6-N-acetyl-D-glucosamine synthase